jgi:hypothetical protein
MDFGRLRWPAWEKDAPQPSPNQSLLSRTAGFVSVMRVMDVCDEKGLEPRPPVCSGIPLIAKCVMSGGSGEVAPNHGNDIPLMQPP